MTARLPAEVGLVRAIGVRRLTAIIVNLTVGAGIFVLPATAARHLGSAAPFAYLVCALAMALIVTCIAAAGSRVTLTGGLYAYTEVAFGPFIGFLAGVLYWASATFGVASIASAFVDSLAILAPAVDEGALRIGTLLAVVGGLAWVNVRGVTIASRLVETMTVAKLLPLAVLLGAGLWMAPVDPRTWLPLPEASAVGSAAILLIFAFVGIEVALVPSGEIKEPARTVPRAVFLALAFTTTLYLLIQSVAQAVLGADMSNYPAAPLAEAATRLIGGTGRMLVLAGAAISMFGYLSGDMLGTPRAIYAFGRDGLLPKALAAVHPRFHTPWLAVIVHAALTIALAVSGGFTELVVIANVATLLLYLFCVAAAYQLQRLKVQGDGPAFVLPAGPLIPIAAAALILWLLSQATRREFVVTGGVLAAAALVYALKHVRSDAMSHRNPSDDELRTLLSTVRTIAMVGASADPQKPSNGIMRQLQQAGYRVIPVNPRETEVLGEPSFPSLVDVPERIDIVDVFRRSEDTPPIADEAVTIGAKALWLQSGIANDEAATRAASAGLLVVMDTCIAATHRRLKI